jgi:hypothetical protein
MATRLKNLSVREISFAKRGANKGARILVYKSEQEPHMAAIKGFIGALRSALRTVAVGKKGDGTILSTDEEVLKALDEDVARLEKHLSSEVKKEKPAFLNDEEDDEGEETPPEGDEDTSETEETDEGDKDKSNKGKIMKQAIAKAEDTVRRAEQAIAKAGAEAAEATAVAKAANERIAKFETAERNRVAVEKAKELLGGMPGNPEELAKVLQMGPEVEAALTPILQKARETAAALTTEIGKYGKIGVSVGDAVSAKASEIRKSDSKMTEAQAIRKVFEMDPSLYEQSLTK